MLNFYKHVKNNVQNDWYDTIYCNVKLLNQFSNFFLCVGLINMTNLSLKPGIGSKEDRGGTDGVIGRRTRVLGLGVDHG